MNRRHLIPALAAAAALPAAAAGSDPLLDLLAASQKEKKGVNVYVKGQQIGLLVTNLGDKYVEGRSQAQSRIVIKIDSIDAATMA